MIRGIHCDLALKLFVNPFFGEKSTVYIGLMFLRKIYKQDYETGKTEVIDYSVDSDKNQKGALQNKGYGNGKYYVPDYRANKLSVLIRGDSIE